jgi:adenylate cyclase
MRQTRRLAAILAADVAGYSRLIGADEEGTLDRLRAIRAELIDPKIGTAWPSITPTCRRPAASNFGSESACR